MAETTPRIALVGAPEASEPSANHDDAPTRPRARAGEPLAPGTLVGRYLVIRHIGAGGLGDVYAAFDTELERQVAIKFLRAGELDALGDRRSRILREAQALARLRHGNVVAVHDVGEHEGELFLAMELVDGQTVDAWLGARPRSWAEIRDVFVAAGEGLAAAHRAGIVHRDVKPSNLVIDRDGRVVVLDFGLARASVGELGIADDTPLLLTRELTQGGVVLGTPQYIAPELWHGAPASERSDQFALCVAMWKALHDRLPFAGDTVRSHRAAMEAGRLVRGAAPRRIPAWLERALVRGLAADPGQRHADMDALRTALVRDRLRRRRALVAVLVAVPLVSAAIALAAWAWRPAPVAYERGAIAARIDAAHQAAAHGDYVVPPLDDPAATTAIAEVLALEATADPAARTAAAELRTELAEALIALGDRYGAREGGAAFATDFYAAALVFAPGRSDVRERVAWTEGQLVAWGERARAGTFSAHEREAAAPLAALADTDPERRIVRVRRLAEGGARSARTRADLDALLADETDPPPAPSARAREQAPPLVAMSAPAVPTPVAAARADPPSAHARDPIAARTEARTGISALRGGRLEAAAAAFHRALQLDRSNVDALGGLAELHFERSEYREAEGFAARATAVASRRAPLWILLGDARMKLLRYDDARAAYERARALGSDAAAGRLDRLARRLGG